MANDAVCRSAIGYESNSSPHYHIEAFNEHIAPIAKLYGFELQMEVWSDGKLKLRGDVDKAQTVLLYLCRESRTREIDWLLDTVTWFQLSQLPVWNGQLVEEDLGQETASHETRKVVAQAA